MSEWGSLTHEQFSALNKEMSSMEDPYHLAQQYVLFDAHVKEAKALLATSNDEEIIAMAKDQLQESQVKLEEILQALKITLLPRDVRDERNVFLEIRPAAGGDESSLFAHELMRSYIMYAQLKWRKSEIVEYQASDVGGLKFVVIKVSWKKVFSRLKYESGVHRVQRIPDTESSGRIHTSTVTIAIMPEADEVDFYLDMNDIQMDTYAASSSWGQNANKNQTWVRLHHKPTWIIVTIGDSKSQLQNKEKAYAVLRAKLYQRKVDVLQEQEQAMRWSQVGTWDRSEKIRTYNFPQDRVTDHRLRQSRWNIPAIMAGGLDDIIDSLIVNDQVAQLSVLEL